MLGAARARRAIGGAMSDAAIAAPRCPARRLAPVLAAAVLPALLLAVLLASLASGRFAVSTDAVARILLSAVLPIAPDWTVAQATVVLIVRLPRALLAGVCGGGLAIAGAALQGVFRNPLVGPQTVGASSGAALGGVAAIIVAGFGPAVVGAAFVGAAAALAIVVAIARAAGGFAVLTLVLAGTVVGAFAAALVSLATFFADPETQLPGIVYWLMGSFATASWDKLATATVCTGVAGALLVAMRWRINVLSLGDEDAAALGVNVARDRLVVLGAVCLIVAAQVSVSGIIGWVGLVIPHVARLMVGPDHRRVLPVAGALGAAYLMATDTMARSLTPAELPIGILTALVGAPVFAVLLARAARGGALPRD
jgi:iron complex transport system permease protein